MHAFIDANVFVSVRTLDVVLSFAQARLYEPSWSQGVENEALRAVSRLRPDAVLATRRMIENANRAFPFARVEVPAAFDTYGLPDKGDEHVLAAALGCEADVIVTYNLKDFPEETMGSVGLKAMHPDAFLLSMLQESPETAVRVMGALVSNKKRPPITMSEELAMLERNGLGRFASAVRDLT